MSIKILTDSSSDLPLQYVENNSDIIEVIGMPITIDGKEYIDDLGKTLSHKFFYEQLKEGLFPTTSQINVTVFNKKFKELHDKGHQVIYLGLSKGLSGTMNNAILAKNMLLEECSDADITVIDTIAACGGLGVLVAETVELVKKNKSKEDILEWLDYNIKKVNHWFAIDDLIHLKKGGRIPSTIAYVGTALKVKPILTLNLEGELKSYASVRGRIKSLKFLYNQFVKNIDNVNDRIIFIGHANCYDDAIKIKEMIEKAYTPQNIVISELSATIATHVGPGMISIAFIGNESRE